MIKILFFAIIFIASYLFYSQYNEISRLKLEKASLQEVQNRDYAKEPLTKDNILKNSKSFKDDENLKHNSELNTTSPYVKKEEPLSAEILKFIKDAKIDIILPKSYSYSYFEDFRVENIGLSVLQGIDGIDSINIIGMRYIAKNLSNLLLELSENTHILSGLSVKDITSLSKANKYFYKSNIGIKKINLVKYQTKKKYIYAGYAIRSDMKGSYLIIASSTNLAAKNTLMLILNSLKSL